MEVIGPHVAEGHYDLVGPHNEIIMPSVWETVVEPNWEISMHMWPIPEPKPEEEALADGLADTVVVEEGVPPPPPPAPLAPGGKAVHGAVLPPTVQLVICANYEQERKGRKRRKRFHHSWVGQQASHQRRLAKLRKSEGEFAAAPCIS